MHHGVVGEVNSCGVTAMTTPSLSIGCSTRNIPSAMSVRGRDAGIQRKLVRNRIPRNRTSRVRVTTMATTLASCCHAATREVGFSGLGRRILHGTCVANATVTFAC